MNDGMYTNIRNYLEDIASKQGQILTELKRINAQPQAATRIRNPVEGPIKKDAPLAGTLETEPPPDAHLAAVTQDVLTPKSPVEVTPKATKPDFTVTVEDTPKPKATPKKGK